MREYLKTGITLMIITVIAALLLSVVYSIVREPITNAELGAKLKAIRDVLEDPSTRRPLVQDGKIPQTAVELATFEWSPEAIDFGEGKVYVSDDGRSRLESPAYKFVADDGRNIYVVIGSSVGYGGDVKTMAAFVVTESGLELNGIRVLEYSQETPGLGANIASIDIQNRFFPVATEGLNKGLKVNQDANVTPTGDEITLRRELDGIITVSDVMTGATITPRAVAFSINAMYQFLKKAGAN